MLYEVITEACVQIFFIRNGKLIGREYFILEGTEEAQDQEVIKEFLKQFYSEAANIPSSVLLPDDIEEMNIIRQCVITSYSIHYTKLYDGYNNRTVKSIKCPSKKGHFT